jgi:hypothetical protein
MAACQSAAYGEALAKPMAKVTTKAGMKRKLAAIWRISIETMKISA